MRILILTDSFPPQSYGGAGRVAFDLSQGLIKKGHQVAVLTTSQNKKAVGFKPGIPNIYTIYAPNYHHRWMAYLSLYNPWTVKQVNKIIKNIKPDVVHAHNVHHYLSYHCLKIAKKYCQAVFLTTHDVMLYNYAKSNEFINKNNLKIPKNFNYKVSACQQIKRFKMRYNPLRNIIIRHYLKYADKIFAVSQTLKHALAQNKIKNVNVIYNAIDASSWQINQNKIEDFKNKYNLSNKKVVLFGGRLSALKGGDEIIQAMSEVVSQIPQAILLIIGQQNNYTQWLKRLAQQLKVPIVFTGWLANNELKAAYHSSQIIATPSLCLDVFNIMNLEAMACQKPVVGTCFGGTPEIVIDNQTGYIINPLNTKIMAEKIIDLLKNPEKTKQFGQAGYQRAKENFSLDKQIDETLMWYNRIIK